MRRLAPVLIALGLVFVLLGTVSVTRPPSSATVAEGRHAGAPPLPTLRFELGSSGPVDLAVFDARGRLVRRLLTAPRAAGRHEVSWDGRDAAGRDCAAGVYLLRLDAGEQRQTGRAVLVR
jgi:hypothetical protein